MSETAAWLFLLFAALAIYHFIRWGILPDGDT